MNGNVSYIIMIMAWILTILYEQKISRKKLKEFENRLISLEIKYDNLKSALNNRV